MPRATFSSPSYKLGKKEGAKKSDCLRSDSAVLQIVVGLFVLVCVCECGFSLLSQIQIVKSYSNGSKQYSQLTVRCLCCIKKKKKKIQCLQAFLSFLGPYI